VFKRDGDKVRVFLASEMTKEWLTPARTRAMRPAWPR
jgi:hypothetical protein